MKKTRRKNLFPKLDKCWLPRTPAPREATRKKLRLGVIAQAWVEVAPKTAAPTE